MWWWNEYGPHGGPWIFWPFMMVLGLTICGAMMVFMMRGMMGHGRSGDRRALEILKERFARGEITQAQFEEQRRLLEA
jgi:putative membrane protein